MNRTLLAALTVFMTSGAMAATDHYIRRDGNQVQHLKITRSGDDITVSMDVDAEPAGQKACSAEVSGDAKTGSNNELVMRKQIEGEARHCALTIRLNGDAARVEQSPECDYFAAQSCRFDSNGKDLQKIR